MEVADGEFLRSLVRRPVPACAACVRCDGVVRVPCNVGTALPMVRGARCGARCVSCAVRAERPPPAAWRLCRECSVYTSIALSSARFIV